MIHVEAQIKGVLTMRTLWYRIPLLLFIALLPACGASPQAARSGSSIKAVIKPSALAVGQNVAGIQMAITVPAGVSPVLVSDGTVNTAATVEITSTSAQNQNLPGATYTPATAAAPGQLAISAIVASGFTPNDAITIHLNVAVDSFPVESDFKLLSFDAFDTNGAKVTGLNPTLTTTILY